MPKRTQRIRGVLTLNRVTLALAIACTLAPLAACARSPLRPDDERTPFDRYRKARNELPAPFTEDEFGRRTPNLRGRLLRPDDE